MSKYLLSCALLFSLIFLQTGCSNKSEIQEYKKHVSIYLLSAASGQEWFNSVKDFSAITAQEKALVPWPKAVRITDIAETENGTIVILVNKKGVAVIGGIDTNIDNDKSVFSSKITDESLSNFSSGKIITGINSVLCHIYIDSFFDNNLPFPLSPFAEIDFDNKKTTPAGGAVYKAHNYPAIIDNLSLINIKNIGDKWFSAWKKSDTNETILKYFVHNSAMGENASEISESEFMRTNLLLNDSNLPDNIKEFISNIIEVEKSNNSVIELELRSKDNPVVITYLAGAVGSNSSYYEKMCVSAEQDIYFISYKGEIYLIENNNIYMFSELEKLPNNYNYTVLYVSEGTLYAAWEYQSFFLTGASGLTLIDIKKVDKILQ